MKTITITLPAATVAWLETAIGGDIETYIRTLVTQNLIAQFVAQPPAWGADILAPLWEKIKPTVTVGK